MGMAGLAAAAIVGLGATSAISSIAAGNQEAKALKRQGEYNAQVYEQQAEMIAQQKKLKEYQANREMAKFRGATVARIGKSGLNMSGSPLAVMVDNETQMQLDKAIYMYNYDVERSFTLSQAKESRYAASEQGRLARSKGYSGAITSIFGTAAALYVPKTTPAKGG